MDGDAGSGEVEAEDDVMTRGGVDLFDADIAAADGEDDAGFGSNAGFAEEEEEEEEMAPRERRDSTPAAMRGSAVETPLGVFDETRDDDDDDDAAAADAAAAAAAAAA